MSEWRGIVYLNCQSGDHDTRGGSAPARTDATGTGAATTREAGREHASE